MKKAFAYLRVSSRGQITGDGFGRQMEAIEDYSKRHRYEIAGVFREEAISGSAEKEDRPAFQAMVSEILRGGTNIAIIEDLSRLARLFRIQETLATYLASKGVQLIAANTGENISEAMHADPTRKAMIQVQGVFSELDKALLIRRLRKARQAIRARGEKCEGRKSYHESDPGLIKRIKQLRRKPKNGRPMSYAKIAEAISNEGYQTRTGTAWKARNINDILRSEKERAKQRARKKARKRSKEEA